MDSDLSRELIDGDVEDDDMPPLVDNPNPLSNYTFLTDPASLSLSNVGSSQVTPSTITITSSTFNSATESLATASNTPPPSPLTPEEQGMPSSSTKRPRSKATRGGAGKKRESSHIPRPPNAFILFRSSFIRSQQIPDRVEGNHSNLSKIIGHYWRALSPEERAGWEAKAVAAQEEHRNVYPDWRFRPGPYAMGKLKTKDGGGSSKRRNTVSKTKDPPDALEPSSSKLMTEESQGTSRGKGKGKDKDREVATSVDEKGLRDSRCEKIASLMMEGKTGSELASAVEEWEDLNQGGGRSSKSNASHADDHHLFVSKPSPASTLSPPSDLDRSSSSNSRRSTAHPHSSTASSSSSFQVTPRPPSALPQKEGRKANSKGISEVPLTQMFTQPYSSPTSMRSPSIADLCPPTNFESSTSSKKPVSSKHRASPLGDLPPLQVDYSRSPDWGVNDPIRPYQSSLDHPYWWNENQSRLDEGVRNSGDGKSVAEALPPGQMGYESSISADEFDRTYQKRYGSLGDLPLDGSEAVGWSTNPNRLGRVTIVPDPCMSSEGNSPVANELSPASLPLCHEFQANTNDSPDERQPLPTSYYYHQPLPPVTRSSNLPSTSFSTLTGWAGDYDYNSSSQGLKDPASSSLHPAPATSWYSREAEWPQRQNNPHLGMALAPEEWDEMEGQHTSSTSRAGAWSPR